MNNFFSVLYQKDKEIFSQTDFSKFLSWIFNGNTLKTQKEILRVVSNENFSCQYLPLFQIVLDQNHFYRTDFQLASVVLLFENLRYLVIVWFSLLFLFGFLRLKSCLQFSFTIFVLKICLVHSKVFLTSNICGLKPFCFPKVFKRESL